MASYNEAAEIDWDPRDRHEPDLVERLEELGAWWVGDCDIEVVTENGARYGVSEKGWVTGGGAPLSGAHLNKLVGSVEEPRGPVIVGAVVPGLRLEIHRSARSMYHTGVVVRWSVAPSPACRTTSG